MPKSAQPKPGTLREMQRAMLDAIRQPLRPDQTMQRGNREFADATIASNDRLTSFERLEVYNQQYWWRLTGLFGDDFPGVRAVIGPRCFDKLTIAYLSAHPSHSWTLRNLGSHLPAFLAENPALTGRHCALAYDVARVEWAATLAFDEPAREPISPAKLAAADPSRLRLGIQPYLQLVELRHPVDTLLAKLRKRTSETTVSSNAAKARRAPRPLRLSVKPLPEPLFLAVHRVDNIVYFKRIDAITFSLVAALRAGSTLEEACEAAFATVEMSAAESVLRVRETFAMFIKLDWLCR